LPAKPSKHAYAPVITKRSDVSSQVMKDNLIPLDKIKVNLSQPRGKIDTDGPDFRALVASVKENGVLQPILLRPIDGDLFEIVAGERRYRAAKELSLEVIPAHIRNLNDLEGRMAALVENLTRADLNPLEETESILALLVLKLDKPQEDVVAGIGALNYASGDGSRRASRTKANEATFTVEEQQVVLSTLSQMGRITIKTFVDRLALLKWPESLREKIRTGKLPYTLGQIISHLEEPQQSEILEYAIEQRLTKSQLREHLAKTKVATITGLGSRAQRVSKVLDTLTNEVTRQRAADLLAELEKLIGLSKAD
jgi:ParB family transcriptional regulator, chromosome partitioning protein